MRLGFAGPCDLAPLARRLNHPAGLPGGLGSPVVPLLVEALLDLGEDVVLYTLDESVAEPRRFDGPGLRVWIGPYRARRRMRDLMRRERGTIRDMIAADPADAVAALWTYEFALGALAAGVPTLAVANDWAPTVLRYAPDPYRAGRLALSTWCLTRARHFAAPSPHIAAKLGFWGLRAEILGQPVPDLAAYRRTDKAPNAPFVFVGAGFGRLKNLRTLLRAMPSLRRTHPDARLEVFGPDNGSDGAAARWARANGCADGVAFHGLRPHADVLRAVAAARALVHPSREESFGQAVAEAMALGTPTIAHADGGAVPWLLEHGACGVLVDARDPLALAAAMAGLVAEPARADALAARAIASVARRFTPEIVAMRYRDALRRIAAERSAAIS